MEAGWFGKNKNYVKKEVVVKNNHYLDEKEKITTEVTNLKEKHTELLNERNALIARNKALEAELAGLRNAYNKDKNIWVKEKK